MVQDLNTANRSRALQIANALKSEYAKGSLELDNEDECMFILSSMNKVGGHKEALSFFNLMKHDGRMQPNVNHYVAAMIACRKSGQWQQALSRNGRFNS